MDEVSQVREKIDIVSLISESLPLKKMGRNFKVVCPFHTEKTPSFVVSPERQIWHCFGCQKGGDVYSFLMEYESLDFPEALRTLAKKAGIELRERTFQPGVSSKKEKIYLINRQALLFYHFLLTRHNIGKKALFYLLEKRGIRREVIDTFFLGFAPRIGNSLSGYLINKKKYKREDIIEAGLAYQKGQEVVDFFKGRVMFPLFDHRDNVVGFSGRSLEEGTDSKYINTRDTLVYQKGGHFFGLNGAKDAIKKQGQAILVEGEFDVISLFQEGIKNVIAIKGSSLTEQQVTILSRFTKNVSLCFDVDTAGLEAIKKSVPILEKKGLTSFVVEIPFAKDPDEAIRKNKGGFKKLVGNKTSVYDFLFNKAVSHYTTESIEGKKKIADELLPYFSEIENAIVKEHYFKKLSSKLDVSYASIVSEASKTRKKELSSSFVNQTNFGKKSREEILEEYLLALIVQAEDPSGAFLEVKNILFNPTFDFHVPSYQKILGHLSSYLELYPIFDSKNFLQSLPHELISSFDECYLFPLPKFEEKEKYFLEIIKVAKELKLVRLRLEIKTVGEKIKEKEEEKGGDTEHLKKEFSNLLTLLRESQIAKEQ